MKTASCQSAAETGEHGAAWGRCVPAPCVIGLSGDLGAGKTAWTQGFARGAGYAGRVRSPTFGLVHRYAAQRFTIWHLDLYRLETPAALLSAGLQEFLPNPAGVAVVEWFERWTDAFPWPAPARLLRIWFRNDGPDRRLLTHDDPGF